MEVVAHVEALRRDGAAMASVLAAVSPDAAVPSCPGWSVRDLARHTGGVHRWATGYVAGPRTVVWDVELDEVVGRWPRDNELASWLGEGCDALAGALASAPPDLQCWTFLPAPSPRAMWARRQAHETAIHRVDAELAAGAAVTPSAAPFAADGVDELLTCFVPRRSSSQRAETPTTLAISCTDVASSWVLRVDGDGVTTTPGGEADGAACTVRGEADDLYRALWNRAGPERLSVGGDRSVLGLFLERIRVRWS